MVDVVRCKKKKKKNLAKVLPNIRSVLFCLKFIPGFHFFTIFTKKGKKVNINYYSKMGDCFLTTKTDV